MQSNTADVYKKVQETLNEDIDLVSAIGDFIQKELADNLREPETLILKIKGLGRWYLRRQRMIKMYEDIARLKNPDYEKPYYVLLKARIDEYEKFLNKKREVKAAKNKFYEDKDNAEKHTSSDSGSET